MDEIQYMWWTTKNLCCDWNHFWLQKCLLVKALALLTEGNHWPTWCWHSDRKWSHSAVTLLLCNVNVCPSLLGRSAPTLKNAQQWAVTTTCFVFMHVLSAAYLRWGFGNSAGLLGGAVLLQQLSRLMFWLLMVPSSGGLHWISFVSPACQLNLKGNVRYEIANLPQLEV